MTQSNRTQVQPDRCGFRTVFTFQDGKVKDEANRLSGQIDDRPATPAGPILLDLLNVEFLGSEDLGALVGLHNRIKGEGSRLTLVNVHPQVSSVLSLTRLDTLFDVHRAPVAVGGGR